MVGGEGEQKREQRESSIPFHIFSVFLFANWLMHYVINLQRDAVSVCAK